MSCATLGDGGNEAPAARCPRGGRFIQWNCRPGAPAQCVGAGGSEGTLGVAGAELSGCLP
jgi:hypothetical protein